MLDQYTYIFVIGTFFAMLDAYNNGASEYFPRAYSSPSQDRRAMRFPKKY